MLHINYDNAQKLRKYAINYLNYEPLIILEHEIFNEAKQTGEEPFPLLTEEQDARIRQLREKMHAKQSTPRSPVVANFTKELKEKDPRAVSVVYGILDALEQVDENFPTFEDITILEQIMAPVLHSLNAREVPTNAGLFNVHGYLATLEYCLQK